MKFSFTLTEIKNFIGECSSEGEYGGQITGIGSLSTAKAGDLSFLANSKYKNEVADSNASVILLSSDYNLSAPLPNQIYLRVNNTSWSLANLCRHIQELTHPKPTPGIDSTAKIDSTATIGKDVYIGPFVSVGAHAIIGDNSIINSNCEISAHVQIGINATIDTGSRILHHSIIGNNVRISAGVVIGSDGFGYDTIDGVHQKIPHIGNVVIGNDVEIGANTTIDRARFASTLIGDGTKIDNLVQIAHNVEIGKGCLIVAQVGISGSTKIADGAVLGGQVGVAGHLQIGKGCMVAAQSGVSKDIKDGSFVRGTPAMPFNQAQKIMALQRKLPDFYQRLNHLENKITERK
jgi:UDP-3-O-[3-hydroxymyristoyl] glucosamine N-acyltransferase